MEGGLEEFADGSAPGMTFSDSESEHDSPRAGAAVLPCAAQSSQRDDVHTDVHDHERDSWALPPSIHKMVSCRSVCKNASWLG